MTTTTEALDLETVTRFWAKVIRRSDTECWGWTASTTKFGYGKMLVNGRLLGAHCISWMIHVGVPTQQILHGCDTPECTNPKHLFEGTQLENVLDCIAKGRFNRPRGERSPRAKLTDNSIRKIRALYHNHRLSLQEIGDRFGVRNQTIDSIVKGRTWKHVT